MKTVRPFDILLPDVAEPEKFAVVSCDQFTSQRDYWEKLAAGRRRQEQDRRDKLRHAEIS